MRLPSARLLKPREKKSENLRPLLTSLTSTLRYATHSHTLLTSVPSQVEQSLRLIGYQHMMSLSITWGRVMQTNANGLLMVNLYGDNGTSGGAIVDRECKLIGLLSKSTTGRQVAYIEPIAPICRVLVKHLFVGRAHNNSNTPSLHFRERCLYCSPPPHSVPTPSVAPPGPPSMVSGREAA
jgi:hypothetical protein